MSGEGAGAAAAQTLVPANDAAAPIDRTVHPSGIVPTLQNIVATVNLATKLDLKQIALTARNAEYNPKVCAYLLGSVIDTPHMTSPRFKLKPLQSLLRWAAVPLVRFTVLPLLRCIRC